MTFGVSYPCNKKAAWILQISEILANIPIANRFPTKLHALMGIK